MLSRGCVYLRRVLFVHEDVHGQGDGRMSWTTIVTPKLHASKRGCADCGRCASRCVCREYNGTRFFGVWANQLGYCGELVAGQGLNVEEGTKPILHSSWKLEPFS